MQKASPTFLQIISRDYLAQNFFLMIFGGWAIYFIDALFLGEYTTLLLVFAAFCTPIGLGTFYWRYNLITTTFMEGIETPGRVVEIKIINTGKNRNDYIIEYEYDHNGEGYWSHNRVKTNPFAKTLRQGQTVELLVNKKKPTIAFIKQIFLELP